MTGVNVVLTAAGLAAGVCSLLAALLLLAERYLVNYGRCAIDINKGEKRLEVEGGQTLLASLMGEEIFVPSACGGRGTCAYCKLTVTEGGGEVIPTEESLLTEEEIGSDVRLSCQVKVRNDLSVLIPEELFLVKAYRGVVEEIKDLTYDIKQLRIRLLEPDTISFKPGQYMQLETPPYDKVAEGVYRAYSISSVPSDENHIELIIRFVPGGICTTWVFEILKEGDEVSLNGPYGEFALKETDKPMVWIAGGSGMAPFWSMIRYIKEKGIVRRCKYFYGAVQVRNLFFLEELKAIEKDLEGFEFVPALSEPAADDRWEGKTGLITEVVAEGVEESSETEFYLCGSEGMIDAAVKVLQDKGATEDQIYYDKFS